MPAKLIMAPSLLLISPNTMTKEKVYYWPLWFSKLLSQREQKKIKKILPKLQIAQLFLWRALNIYDDFLDGEGKREELPKANNYFRRYLEIHYQLNLSSDYYKLFNKVISNLEKANVDEVLALKLQIKDGLVTTPKKLPNWKNIINLSDKSLVLAFGPLALLSALGYKTSGQKMKAGLNFFKYALTAKQLADDSYDWLEDLKDGFITAANTPILKAAERKHITLDFKDKPEILYLLFAQESSPIIITGIEKFCKKAKQEIKKINNKTTNSLISKLILPLEKSCQESKKFIQSALEA